MECKEEENGQTVIPIFDDVDPSHVRYQSESFAEAFAKHESRYNDDVEGMQKVQGWRNVLTAAANLKGHDIRDGIESECIQHIVDQVSSKLCKASVSYLRNVVGIDTHLEKVKSLLEMEINDVRIVGIWGMGGVGKTTIARAIFDSNSNQFDGACFLVDIKENKCGMHSLQNILLSKLLRKKDNYVNNKEDGKHMIARRLRFKKVLVVLDDIDHSDHLDNLAGDLDWFGKGSRIIATTRDKHLIGKNDVVYEVTTLCDHDAIKLFRQYAFKEEVPGECFEKLSLEVVNHAKGLPLALKVWGSFLHKRDITEWRSAIEQMKIHSKSEIVEKLKISYDGLETTQRDVLLDIACFLRGEAEDYIMSILESCYSGANIELSVLIDKSLVFISDIGRVQMHDLIQDMGKYIVKIQKDDPGEYSRLWDAKDFGEVMVNNTGTKAMEAIWLPQRIGNLCFSKKAMKHMKRLKILRIANFDTHDDSIEYLPNSLHWFDCHKYPWESLPKAFEPKRLVHLSLRWSCLRDHLWTEIKHLPFLRRLDLSYSDDLMRTSDFTEMPNLEYLDLIRCRSLEEVHHSLGCSKKLIKLNLSDCKNLKRFPCVNVESLESLNLDSCYSLEKFPEVVGRMKPELDIEMGESGIIEVPSFIKCQTHITKLNLSYMENLVALPRSICKLKDLVKLNVSNNSKLERLPEEIGDLEKLEELDARLTLISRPSSSIVRLNKLKLLTFEKEESEDGANFVFPRVNEGLHSLEKLDLGYCNLIDGGLPEDIGSLSSLKELYLRGNNFEHLPRSIAQLGALRFLELSDCKRLKEFPCFTGMTNLETLDLSFCNLIDGVLPEDIGCLSSLKVLFLQGNNFEHLPRSISQLSALQSLYLSYCNLIDGGLPEDIGCLSSLKKLYLKENNFEYLPRSISQLSGLQSLDLSDCKRLTQLPEIPQQLHTIDADWSNDSICNSLLQNISSLQHENSASNSLSLRVFRSWAENIPSWFHHQGMYTSHVSVNLPENWDNLLGFAVCYFGWRIIDMITAHLIPLCDDGMPSMTQKLVLSNHSECAEDFDIHFLLIPLACLWDASKANGKTPNDYGCIRLYSSGEMEEFGVRLLYKDEAEVCIGIRRNRYEEASCSSSNKQKSAPVCSKTLQLFPTRLNV